MDEEEALSAEKQVRNGGHLEVTILVHLAFFQPVYADATVIIQMVDDDSLVWLKNIIFLMGSYGWFDTLPG